MPRVDLLIYTVHNSPALHFLVGRGCFYDRGKDLDLRMLKERYTVSWCGGRNKVDSSFTALFNVYNFDIID